MRALHHRLGRLRCAADLLKFPPGELPPIEEVTLFNEDEVAGFLKKPGESGYRNPYQLWRPFE